ncbi:MAG: GTP 3',8-cyclase MoaA [Gemmatimonadales bacterium]|nr:GTP 3',8-cyclase MoaA [Gemmatimonadales bacterium]
MIGDRFGRPLGSLRLSVTDRCNMRCGYCMPNENYVWLPRSSILSFEELDRIAGVFASLGARKVRLTGGEPLLRQDLDRLVALLASRPALADLALTTNGILLAEQAAALRRAGLRRVTVSLDTLRPERLREFARSDRHAAIVAGLDAARATGFESVKLNSVIIRGYNDDEVVPLLEFARDRGLELRYIEYMDVGGATRWSRADVVSRADLLATIERALGPVEPEPSRGAAPAERFRLADGTSFGIIASTTAPFCGDCDRSRVTADGTWLLCLYADRGFDLREPLRAGASDADLAALIAAAWAERTDRGAEVRLATPGRGVLHPIERLKADPRREMHTRGG